VDLLSETRGVLSAISRMPSGSYSVVDKGADNDLDWWTVQFLNREVMIT